MIGARLKLARAAAGLSLRELESGLQGLVTAQAFPTHHGWWWAVVGVALLTLMEVPGTTLISVVQLLGDADYRNAIVGRISDPKRSARGLR